MIIQSQSQRLKSRLIIYGVIFAIIWMLGKMQDNDALTTQIPADEYSTGR